MESRRFLVKRVRRKIHRVSIESSDGNSLIRTDAGKYAWAKPYNDPNIKDIPTGLGRGFRYSPIFKNSIVDTMVKLTGYRSKDYAIAETQTGKKHIPKVTVWHHAWHEENGRYLMQLVNFDEHQKTCPHAGGCKMWLEANKKSRYLSNKNKIGYYSDFPYYPVEATERNFFQKGYVSKKSLSAVRRKKARLFGIDMYGNLLYKNAKNIYFWDHESDLLILLNDKCNTVKKYG